MLSDLLHCFILLTSSVEMFLIILSVAHIVSVYFLLDVVVCCFPVLRLPETQTRRNPLLGSVAVKI